MNIVKRVFAKYHEKWAGEKFDFFLEKMPLNLQETILDLGGGDGSYMDRFGAKLTDYSVIIADISEADITKSRKKGYKTITIDGSKDRLPFKDKQIDCVFCNSVIEHITIPKDQLWSEMSNSIEFSKNSLIIQKQFASEIIRCSRKYYVQTPYKYFPVESHSWIPFMGHLDRRTQLRLLKLTNAFWVKKTEPDWNLLTEADMRMLFPDAEIIVIRKFGFKKEIIALRT